MKTVRELAGLIATVACCYGAVGGTAAGDYSTALAWGVAFVVSATLTFRLDWRQEPPEA